MIQYSLISLSDLLAGEYEEERIIEIFKKFSCQRETDLEDFLITKAIMYERANIGKTFLFIDLEKLNNGKTEIIAYFTISQVSLDISEISNKRRKKILGHYIHYIKELILTIIGTIQSKRIIKSRRT